MLEFYSHAVEKNGRREGSKLLKDHLREVGKAIQKLMTQTPAHVNRFIPEIGYLLGIAHDFGKYTTFFQDYLLNKVEDTSLKHHHGFISAIFTAYLIDKVLKNIGDNNKYLPLLAYFVVLHHHGDLNALELDVVQARYLKEEGFPSVSEPWRSKLKTLQCQLEDIYRNIAVIDGEYRKLLEHHLIKDIRVEDFLTSWRDVLSNLDKLRYELIDKENEEERLSIFISILFLYSLLIDSDKKDAADVIDVKRKRIPGDLVDRHRAASPDIDIEATIGIDGIRNKIYTNVSKKASDVKLSNHFFTLTAPTGTGKTLASLSLALKLRERIEKAKGYTPRIIYSLPFTSIIDQNYEVFKDVLRQLPNFDQDENSYLIKHHHLADLGYKTGDEERPLNESLLLVESWESEVIVTTFIQLLHSIIGFKNKFLKKFHNIAGSIILLDEVQNIPIEYWPLVNNMFKLLAEKFGCYIILLTATRPLIFDENEVVPLLDHSEDYFRQLDRVTLIPEKEALHLDEFFQKFTKLYDKLDSYLIVLNTIKSSFMLYKMLKEDSLFEELIEKRHLFYLSTNIIPRVRAERLRMIRGLLKQGEKIVVVSTQVVEAGVDIDLDVVIRDIGPIDSIIQVAGRCNRGMGDVKGKVYVYNLEDDRCSYAKYVYGSTHYVVSRDLLGSSSLEEPQFLDLINRYFSLIVQKKNQDDSMYIWKAIKNFVFHHPNMKSISDFELINEKNGYVDVFVEIDKKAKSLLANYVKGVVKEKDFRKRQDNYLLLRKEFKSYIISVPKQVSVGLESINKDLLSIPYEQMKVYYEDDTGFKWIEDGSIFF
jgi:CRISPR-associated endonuclease/helicase Cas3